MSKCCVKNCPNTNRKEAFFRSIHKFPDPDDDKYVALVSASRIIPYGFENWVCNKHFIKKYIQCESKKISSQKLQFGALPSSCLPIQSLPTSAPLTLDDTSSKAYFIECESDIQLIRLLGTLDILNLFPVFKGQGVFENQLRLISNEALYRLLQSHIKIGKTVEVQQKLGQWLREDNAVQQSLAPQKPIQKSYTILPQNQLITNFGINKMGSTRPSKPQSVAKRKETPVNPNQNHNSIDHPKRTSIATSNESITTNELPPNTNKKYTLSRRRILNKSVGDPRQGALVTSKNPSAGESVKQIEMRALSIFVAGNGECYEFADVHTQTHAEKRLAERITAQEPSTKTQCLNSAPVEENDPLE